jgi:hypothetical protein
VQVERQFDKTNNCKFVVPSGEFLCSQTASCLFGSRSKISRN